MKMFSRGILAAFGLIAAATAMAEAKEQRLVFSGYSGSTTLTDFQALVKLTEGQYGFSYSDYAAQDGTDLWFTDWQGNVIPHEIDLWNASGASYVWVRVPELTGKSTSITMHWGEARTAEQTSTANVWKNNKDGRGGYVGVWHMGKATGAEPEPDATGNGLDAEPYSETSSTGDMSIELNTAWPTGANRQNTGTSGHKNALKVPDYSKVITEDARFTVSGWFRCTNAYNGNYKRFFSAVGLDGKDNGLGWEVRQNGDGYSGNSAKHQSLQLSAYDGTSSSVSTKYQLKSTYLYNTVYITVVFSDRISTIYQNGVLIGSDNIVRCRARHNYLTAEQLENQVNDFGFLIGHKLGSGNSWCGRYDEVRMYDGAESADRVKANYDTMATPNTFLAMPANITGTAKVQQLKFAGYTGDEALTDFQVLVKLFEGQYGFSYDDYSVKDGSDLWFADSDGNVLPHEIETWNPSGDSFIWVRVPEITGPSSYILMHWGAERTNAAEIAASRANVWKNNGDGGYVGVWHMGKATLGESEPDSTGNGLHAMPYSDSGNLSVMSVSTPEGFATPARQNGVSNGQRNALIVPDYSQKITDETRFTLSGWFRCTSKDNGNYKRFFSSSGLDGAGAANGWAVRQNGDYRTGDDNIHRTLALSTFDGTTTKQNDYGTHDMTVPYLNNTIYITVVFDGTQGYVYENGVQQGNADTIIPCKARQSYLTAEQLANPANDFGFLIGNRLAGSGALLGYYDEIRMYDGAESATRIKANYDMMTAPNDFLVTDTAIATAEWTGGGNDGNVANSANWLCKLRTGETAAGALPTVETDVTISGESLYIDLSEGTTLLYRTILFGNCTLARDNDWSGLNMKKVSYAVGTVVDLNGKNLVVSSLESSSEGTISNDDAEQASTLFVRVPEGATTVNAGVLVAGNIRLVKDGKGTFTSSKALTYTGGTLVEAGTAQPPLSTAAYNATFTPFGTGTITIESNAVFNAQSTAAYRNGVILNGGTVMGGAGNGANRPIVMLEKVTADSAISQARAAIDIGVAGVTTDLNGHTVSVYIEGGTYFRWYGSLEGVEGKFIMTGNGYFNDMTPITGPRTVDLELNGAVLNIGYAVYFRDFTANNGNNNYAGGPRNGFYVSGTYTPVGNQFYGCVLQSGATLNLSARELPFILASSLRDQVGGTAEGNISRRTVRFEDNAVISIDVGDRSWTEFKDAPYIVKWDEASKPANLGTLKFVPEGEMATHYVISADEVGLKFVKKRMIIFIR